MPDIQTISSSDFEPVPELKKSTGVSTDKLVLQDTRFESSLSSAQTPQPTPPSLPKRLFCNLCIGFFSFLVYNLECLEAGWFYLFGKHATPSQLKKVLSDLIENDDTNLTHEVLKTYLESRENPKRDDAILADILSLKQTRSYLNDILRGANVRLYGDQGAYFEKWTTLEGVYTRRSSHDVKPGKSRGLTGSFIQELHFWIDRETGDTCFQLEKHPIVGPLWGLINALRHLVDFFRHTRDDLQQGSYGTSPYTDHRPIIIDATRSKSST